MKISGIRVAVTGGAGFIGSHLVDRLVRDGNRVLVIDDFSTGSQENLAESLGTGLVEVAEADIRQQWALERLFKGVDAVFHLACRNVRLSLRAPTLVHEVNATGTLNVLKAAAGAKVRRFLYCSSSEVNGTAQVVPMPEDYHFRPETIYGASKLTGEYYTQVFQRSGWLQTVIARPHNNYGPREHFQGDKAEVIPRFIIRALAGQPPLIYGDGLQTRDFTYVSETADYLVRLMEADSALGGIYNLCRGHEVSISRLAELIAEMIGLGQKPVHLPARPSDVLRLYGDPARLRKLLGDSPSVSIKEGLEQTIAWFRQRVPDPGGFLEEDQERNWEDIEAEPWLASLLDQGSKENQRNAEPGFIPLAKPVLGPEEAAEASRVLASGWVTQGPKSAAFEEEFAAHVGANYACAVSSGTAALHLALLGVGVGPGDAVITVSNSFIATANAARYCQAEPYFVDVDLNTCNMDPAALASALEENFVFRDGDWWLKGTGPFLQGRACPWRRLTLPHGRLGAILLVHQLGMPADLDRLLALAKKYGVPVVEDAACALGSSFAPEGGGGWQAIGRPHGDVACFSLHPRKVITTGEGGVLTTNRPELNQAFRLLRQHGMSMSADKRHVSGKVAVESYLETGFNYRFTDIQAAVGSVQMKRLPAMIRQRRRRAKVYAELLAAVPGVRMTVEPAYAHTNWQSLQVILPAGADQTRVMQKMLDSGVATRPGVMCAHLEPPYQDIWPAGCLPVSEKVRSQGIILPLFPQMEIADCERVVRALHKSLA